jgi:hypothetical protein
VPAWLDGREVIPARRIGAMPPRPHAQRHPPERGAARVPPPPYDKLTLPAYSERRFRIRPSARSIPRARDGSPIPRFHRPVDPTLGPEFDRRPSLDAPNANKRQVTAAGRAGGVASIFATQPRSASSMESPSAADPDTRRARSANRRSVRASPVFQRSVRGGRW